jgi:hypothetical protein
MENTGISYQKRAHKTTKVIKANSTFKYLHHHNKIKIKLSLIVFAHTSMWLTVYGDKSTNPHEMDVEAAMAESAEPPGLRAVHPHDLHKGSFRACERVRKILA